MMTKYSGYSGQSNVMANKFFHILRNAVLATSLATSMAFAATESVFADVVGTWRLSNGKVTVRVNYCGGKNICATIVGMAKPLNKEGKPKTDKDNPNPALRARPVIGLQVVSGMQPDGDNRWTGTIYNADDGGTYSATAIVEGNRLVIKACALGGLACKKRQFARVD
jgi:uncharacterized protein (DUF2147 family)